MKSERYYKSMVLLIDECCELLCIAFYEKNIKINTFIIELVFEKFEKIEKFENLAYLN